MSLRGKSARSKTCPTGWPVGEKWGEAVITNPRACPLSRGHEDHGAAGIADAIGARSPWPGASTAQHQQLGCLGLVHQDFAGHSPERDTADPLRTVELVEQLIKGVLNPACRSQREVREGPWHTVLVCFLPR